MITQLFIHASTYKYQQGMNYRKLGKSDLKISEISFGCMSLKGDDASNKKLIDRAYEKGINFFDTADLYDKGQNELTVGKALKDKRKDVFIATKVGNQWRQDGTGWDWNPTKKYILLTVEESLKRLQTDYIDLYQLHGGTIEDPIDETIETFELLKSQGKIRFYGISSIRPNVIREYVKRSNIVSVMMQYSLLDRRPEEEALPLLKDHEIGVLARGSIAKGLLVNKPAAPFLNYSSDQVEAASYAIKKMVSQGRNASAIALGFVLKNSAITSAVVGIRTEDQLEDLPSNSFGVSENDTEILASALPVNKYDQHR
jgi:aryl-alcohol dehydrogenase-like predicted oxidoreductase